MAVQRQDGLFADCKESAEDLRGKEYLFATRTTAGKFALCGAGGKIAGVISEGRDTGKHTSINTGKQLKVISGAGITAGDLVQSSAEGKAVPGNTNPFGVAMNTVLGGEYVEIDVDRT